MRCAVLFSLRLKVCWSAESCFHHAMVTPSPSLGYAMVAQPPSLGHIMAAPPPMDE